MIYCYLLRLKNFWTCNDFQILRLFTTEITTYSYLPIAIPKQDVSSFVCSLFKPDASFCPPFRHCCFNSRFYILRLLLATILISTWLFYDENHQCLTLLPLFPAGLLRESCLLQTAWSFLCLSSLKEEIDDKLKCLDA